MTILAFDPGVLTGVAVLSEHGTVISTEVISSETEMRRRAEHLKKWYGDADVIAEAPPLNGGNYRAHTQVIEEIIRTIFPDATWANPGQWKGTPPSHTPVPRSLTQHEKDAVHLGRWHKWNRRRSGRNRTV